MSTTLTEVDPGHGKRVSGKNWKTTKSAFRIKSLGVKSTFAKRQEKRLKEQQDKAKLKGLIEEKENEHKARIAKMKEKRAKKEEAERYERLASVMNAKKIERLKRKEKRNKLLKER